MFSAVIAGLDPAIPLNSRSGRKGSGATRGRTRKEMNSQQAVAGRSNKLFELWNRCKAKGWGYWIGAAIVLIVATTGSHFVYEELRLEGLRESLFQTLAEWVPRPTEPRYTRMVLIEDDEYWKGELAGRRPIKRRYLAQLVADLAQANAHVIALDFDVRLPDPSSLAIPSDYAEETKVLIDAIKKAAASGVKIVLATPVSRKTRESTEYRRDSDIYQANGLCVRDRPKDSPASAERSGNDDKIGKNITCGYIALPYDPLAIPGPLPVVGEGNLDSFALAIARAVDGDLVKRMENGGPHRPHQPLRQLHFRPPAAQP